MPCFGSSDSSQSPVKHASRMVASKLELAIRAFVIVLLALARRYRALLRISPGIFCGAVGPKS